MTLQPLLTPSPPASTRSTQAAPVVLLTTENADGTFNLAPISSAWALGQHVVLGLGSDSQTVRNLAERPDVVINLASPDLWERVESLAPLTGADPVPESKRAVYRYERDKFAATGLTPRSSHLVRPPRIAECPLQLEARSIALTPGGKSRFLSVECEVVRVHADERIVVPGTHHIDPGVWSPLIYNFRHYHGLTPELGHGFRSETVACLQRLIGSTAHQSTLASASWPRAKTMPRR